MSDRRFTGYDNEDVTSAHVGERLDEEVYEYDAQTAGLVCASCNPTGARPIGHLAGTANSTRSLPDLNSVWTGKWVAGSTPDWVEFKDGYALYQPRYLSDDGRLFFDVSDALVPQDINGTEDVYEYEPVGVGGERGCLGDDSTYDAGSAGCISLISGGTGEDESVFADASATGDDVFFVTAERLVGSDIDKAYDMYDAHVCSAGSPCPSAAAAVPPPCETADSCRAAASPQPGVFGAPATSTFSGAGNLASPAHAVAKPKAKPAKCKKGFVKKKNRCFRKKKPKTRKPGNKRRTVR
jgi:hypothetical protein